ncbi:hypothetical protein ACN47E_009438 [Coniothyrium glycines]
MEKPNGEEYGWLAVPRDRSNVPSTETAKTRCVIIDLGTIWPDTDLVRKARDHAKQKLPLETYNHSIRVFCYGQTIVEQHFPHWIFTEDARSSFFETWALTCLFHDIGTTPENRLSTHMSFEFQGGFIALQQLQSFGAPQAQAESVAEAIIRHQDPGKSGTISRMGQLVQLATEFDNMGWQPHLIHEKVIEQVVDRLPRMKWSTCFAKTIGEEIEEKPWCHTTALEGFRDAVLNNKLMEPYD